MSFRKILNGFFIVVPILALLVVFGFFSYASRNLFVDKVNVLSSEEGIVYDNEDFGYDVDDPFITPGPAAKKILFKPVIGDDDPVLGEGELSVVEFSDFSCKFCAKQEEIIRDVINEYKGKVKLVWKDFPDKDTPAYQAALAARCAGEQGKFWQFHDFLFEQDVLASLTFLEAAKRNQLDLDKFSLCIKNKETDKNVNDNIKEAGALRLSGVPFFFIGKQEILGAINKEDLRKIIDQALYELKD